MMPGTEIAISNQDALEQTPEAKPSSSAVKKTTRGSRWKSKKTRSKLEFKTGKFMPCAPSMTAEKEFEDMTVSELRCGYNCFK